MDDGLKCVWDMDTPCGGDVTRKKMFDTMELPICKNHFTEHQRILFLESKGIGIEKIIELPPEEKYKLFKKVRAKFPDDELPT